MKTKIVVLFMVLLLSWAGNAISVSFQWIELTSDNRESGWYLQTNLALNNPNNPTVEYSWDGVNFHPMEFDTWGWYEFFIDNVTDRSAISPPTDFNNNTFIYRVVDGSEALEASGTVNTIRQIALSKDVTIVKPGIHPIISWTNSDSNIFDYRIRVLDESEDLLWQDTLHYEENPTYQIIGFTFTPQKQYYIRIEGRRNDTFTNISGDTVSWFNNLNRSVVKIPYNFENTNSDETAQVLNPGFEQGKNGWHMGSTSGTDCQFDIDADAYEGSNAAKLTITNDGYCMLGNSAPIPIRRTGLYVLKLYAKVAGDVDHLTIAVWKTSEPNTNPDVPVDSTQPNVFSGDYEPHELTIFLYSGEYIRLELGIDNNASGPSYVLFDNIELINPVYDTFEADRLDTAKWGDLEIVREISDGELRLNVQGNREQVSSRLHPIEKTNYLQASVVVEGDSWAYNGGSSGLEGMFYNMSRGPGSGKDYDGDKGEAWIKNQIRLDENNNLIATAQVIRIDDRVGNSSTTLFSQNFSTSVNFDEAVTLSVEYDVNNSQIIFKCNGDEVIYDINTPEYPSGTDYRAIQTGIAAGDDAGYMKTRVDDVYLQQGIVYDDFAGDLLDPSRWEDLTLVRETDDGKLRLDVQALDVRTDNTLPLSKHDITNLEAIVNVSSDSWVSAGATGFVRVAGWYFNDSRNGKARKYKGNKGDVWAQNSIELDESGQLVAICFIWRSDTPDPWGPGTTLFYKEFNTDIDFDTPYTLGIDFVGRTFTFRCNDEYYQYEVTGNKYAPSELRRQIQSRVYADDGESGYMQVEVEDVDAGFRKITLLSPDGGEVLHAGQNVLIEWRAPPNAVKFKLMFSSDNGKKWKTLAKNRKWNNYEWSIDPQDRNLNKCLVKVIGYDVNSDTVGSDQSDKPFTVEVVKLTTPNGSEVFLSGGSHDVSWITRHTKYDSDIVKIYCSTNKGKSWKLMKTVRPDPGTTTCKFPKVTKNENDCLVKVQLSDDAGRKTGTDVSNNPFTVEVLRLNSPNGGETLTSGQTYSIDWDTYETKKKVAKAVLTYTKNGGNTWAKIKTIKGDSPGTYPWAVPVVPKTKTKCKAKVQLYDANGKSLGIDSSDGFFAIEP